MRLYLILLMILPLILFAEDWQARLTAANLSIYSNGTFDRTVPRDACRASSPNGRYWCTYTVGRVSHGEREVWGFRLFDGDREVYALEKMPGSDLYLSDAGYAVFLEMNHHPQEALTARFYALNGREIFHRDFTRAALFGFSPDGTHFGVSDADGLHLIDIASAKTRRYPAADQFAVSADNRSVAIARGDRLSIYHDGAPQQTLRTGFTYPRRIALDMAHKRLAIIDKRHLQVYDLGSNTLQYEQRLSGAHSFRDVMLVDGRAVAGIHYRHDGLSRGILRVLDDHGDLLHEAPAVEKRFETFAPSPAYQPASTHGYRTIPWPFVPFDSLHTVWNYYEQHMGRGGATNSYLHQGLDMIVPINEPTYAVEPGVVKLVLTLGGAIYWRIATSLEQLPGTSRGWLYAHLVESSIQFSVGDTVALHDYLGDIIFWAQDWGHIHFVEIEDSGLVWRYSDDEWGITYNPLNSLQPNTDSIPPVLDDVFPGQKIAFPVNQSDTYLSSDSLYGAVDIVIKVVDYIGESPWQQPAYETYYQVKKLPEGDVVFPRTLGRRLNHYYGFYSAGNYENYAPLNYKRDSQLLPSSWMDMNRNYYHILTNSDGDSLIDLSEAQLAFNTTEYIDGQYRIIVEAFDQFGNRDADSMDVWFKNGITTGIREIPPAVPEQFLLLQNYPNPFNPRTTVEFAIADADWVKLTVHDLLGRTIAVLVNERRPAGRYQVTWDGRNDAGEVVANGVYIYRLTAGDPSDGSGQVRVATRKMMLVK